MPDARQIPDYEYPECHHSSKAEDIAREIRAILEGRVKELELEAEMIRNQESNSDSLPFEVIEAFYAFGDRLTPEVIWVKPKGLGYTPFEYRRVHLVPKEPKEDTSNYPEIFRDVDGDE